jgi:hypothetical protein
MSFFTLTYVLLWLLVAFETLVLLLMFREIGALYLVRREAFERDGPPLGKPLPTLVASTDGGEPRGLGDLPAPVTALVFGAFGCRLCPAAIEKFERWQQRVPDLGLVVFAERPAGRSLLSQPLDGRSETWLLEEGEMLRVYGVRATPYVVLVSDEGIVLAKGLVNHHSDIKGLLRSARDSADLQALKQEQTVRPEPASARA